MHFLLNWTIAAVSVTSGAAHPTRTRENDFLCNHASNWAVLFLKWFVFEHGDFSPQFTSVECPYLNSICKICVLFTFPNF